MSAVIERKPGTSRGARWFAPLLRRTVRPLMNITALLPLLLRLGFLVDYLGALMPPPRGTRRHRVNFDGYPGELLLGPGVRADTERAVLYFHGGGFLSCGLRTHRRMLARLSRAADAQVLHVAYRQLPKVKLRRTIDDCVAGYELLISMGHPPEKIVFGGDSAGGYLVFGVALRALERGLPVPAGIMALSPAIDLDGLHHAEHANFRTDPYISASVLPRLAALLADGDPLESLLTADLSALPPTLIQVGGLEVLLSDAELMTARLDRAGVPARLQIWDGQVHVFQAFADIVPEGHAAIEELGGFVRTSTDLRTGTDLGTSTGGCGRPGTGTPPDTGGPTGTEHPASASQAAQELRRTS